ncbi:hypothetical protein [Caldibacillus debilis]|uniref:Uncharacterized protein n=1 Tax=Caldibacillus debilis TaxID=301148 RepID=A0A150L6V5_9BACI|nr:hypothetical protein [Caldibacillus debilis]KYD08038.1 hypothetical protein B4135_4195 [Caldibacillus debilis]
MRYLAVANFEKIDDVPFFVVNLYDNTGHLADQIVVLKTTLDDAVYKLRELAFYYDITNFEVWTSDKALFKRLLTEAGMAASLKTRGETHDTYETIKQHEQLLREFHFIEPRPASRWWKKLLGVVKR